MVERNFDRLPKWLKTEERAAKLAAALQANKSYSEAGAVLGVTASAISGAVTRAGGIKGLMNALGIGKDTATYDAIQARRSNKKERDPNAPRKTKAPRTATWMTDAENRALFIETLRTTRSLGATARKVNLSRQSLVGLITHYGGLEAFLAKDGVVFDAETLAAIVGQKAKRKNAVRLRNIKTTQRLSAIDREIERSQTQQANGTNSENEKETAEAKINAVARALETGAKSIGIPGAYVESALSAIKNGTPLTPNSPKEKLVQIRLEKTGGFKYASPGKIDSAFLAALKTDLESGNSKIKAAARRGGVGRISVLMKDNGTFYPIINVSVN